MLEWFAITCSAARLGLEAQNAAAFRLLRLAGGVAKKTAEIAPEAVAPSAYTAPEPVVVVAPKRRHAASKVDKEAAPVKKRRKRTK
jgi:hypothetical protein